MTRRDETKRTDDDVEDGDDAVDNGHEDGADGVDDGHDALADGAEDGLDLWVCQLCREHIVGR